MKCYGFKRSQSIDRIRRKLRRKMPPNTKEVESPAETENLLGRDSLRDAEEHELKQEIKKTPKQSGPDGLRAWVVAFANFLINFIVVGLGRMSGILYIVFLHMFHIDRKTASMPFSIQQAARNLFGPLAGILGQKYGIRWVTILGGVIGTISAIACFFVMNMTWITILWGLVFGLCTALTTTLNQVPIDQYFERHRTTAGGFAFSGGCVAAFIFPVILEYLISNYGMGHTFLIMGACIFFVIPSAMILVEPPWKKKAKIEEVPEEDDNVSFRKRRLQNYNTFSSSSARNINKRDRKEIDFDFLREKCEFLYQLFVLILPDEFIASGSISESLWDYSVTFPLVNELEAMYNYLKSSSSTENNRVEEDLTRSVHVVEVTINGFPKQNSTDAMVNPIEVGNENTSETFKTYIDNPRWLFLALKIRELCECRESALLLYFASNTHSVVKEILDMLKILNEMATENESSANVLKSILPIPVQANSAELPESHRKRRKKRKVKHSNSFAEHIMTALKLHMNPLFLLICLCRGVFMLTFIPLVTIIVDFSMEKGLKRSSGKYVIAILSLGDLLGRLCLGWINDSGLLSLPRYMLVVMLLLAISTATLPLMHSEISLMPAILIFGMLQGSLFVRHQNLVSKYMDPNEQAIGMGFINLLSGFIGFALPFYIGYFKDTLGSYDQMFYLNGAICAFIGLMWTLEPLFVRFTSNRSKNDLITET